MTTSSGSYVGIDVAKERLDIAVWQEGRAWQVDNTPEGIASLAQQVQALGPELIVVEATGGDTSGEWWRRYSGLVCRWGW
jgi:transposase